MKSASDSVSVLMLSRLADHDIQRTCFSSILSVTNYANYEIILLANNFHRTPENTGFLRSLPFRTLESEDRFNWSAMNNVLAKQASGEFLLFLNDDIEVISPDWMEQMIELAKRPEIGAVGAVLLYPNETIQHAGLYLMSDGSNADHILRHCKSDEEIAARFLRSNREVSCVTGACIMVRRSVFEEVGGFDEAYPLVANDTDFCLRLIERGYRNALAVNARLTHYEAISRTGMVEDHDVTRFRERWGKFLGRGDPYFPPFVEIQGFDIDSDFSASQGLVGRRNYQLDHQRA